MKHKIVWLMCLIALCMTLGCDNSDDEGDGEKEETFENWVSTPEMLERSLVSMGNNFRMKKVLNKVANNEPVTVAYIGGSITEAYTQDPAKAFEQSGGSYAVGSFEKFKARFAPSGGSNINYVNAGMGGTPSSLGILRYGPEVLDQAPTPPDLVVVEFAVNDGDDVTDGAAYESLVRKILTGDSQPAVLLLFCVFRTDWNLEDRLVPIGTAYQLPMVSIKRAVVPEFDAGAMTKDEFFRDEYHPNGHGFEIMAETLDYYFYMVDRAAPDTADITLPTVATIGYQYTDIQSITTTSVNADVTVDVGSFTEKDTSLPTYAWSLSKRKTEENFHKSSETANDPFTITGSFKNMLFSYKVSKSSDFGAAEVYIDGVMTATLQGQESDAWNQPKTVVLLDEETAASHTVEIKMAESDADKKFTIIMLGYTP